MEHKATNGQSIPAANAYAGYQCLATADRGSEQPATALAAWPSKP